MLLRTPPQQLLITSIEKHVFKPEHFKRVNFIFAFLSNVGPQKCMNTHNTNTESDNLKKKKKVFYFLNQSTVKPSSSLLNLIFYKLDINIIQGPSQNAT